MMINFNNPTSGTNSSTNNLDVKNDNNVTPTKRKYRKKPDPTAPKITRPCSECGKKFWSQKALFGHMRCHPERQWRGINPPSNLINRHPKENSSMAVVSTSGTKFNDFSKMTQDDHEAALSLLMLANGFGSINNTTIVAHAHCSDQCPSSGNAVTEGVVVTSNGGGGGDHVEVVPGSGGGGGGNCGFECINCKKVFGSPQALGGHRASHKNVKGCFANTRNNDGVFLEDEFLSGNLENRDGLVVVEEDNDKMLKLELGLGLNLGIQEQQQQNHQCNICFRVFSSGQALGGHKRCHWERFDGGNNNEELGIDLNLLGKMTSSPSRICQGDTSHCLHSSCSEALNLRLEL